MRHALALTGLCTLILIAGAAYAFNHKSTEVRDTGSMSNFERKYA